MHKYIFRIVADGLIQISRLTGFTYNEINILVYYFLIPFSWCFLLDLILKVHYCKIAFALCCLGFFIGCRDFRAYSDWLFDKSVSFLQYFNRYGSNYVASSVWICVSLPILVYAILFYMILK